LKPPSSKKSAGDDDDAGPSHPHDESSPAKARVSDQSESDSGVICLDDSGHIDATEAGGLCTTTVLTISSTNNSRFDSSVTANAADVALSPSHSCPNDIKEASQIAADDVLSSIDNVPSRDDGEARAQLDVSAWSLQGPIQVGENSCLTASASDWNTADVAADDFQSAL
jgi:hypothetical protein